MSRREQESSGSIEIAFSVPVEKRIDAQGGVSVRTQIIGTSEKAVGRLMDFFSAHGITVRSETPKEARSSVFFSSDNWNTPWQPKGPKPNWTTPPKDPSLN